MLETLFSSRVRSEIITALFMSPGSGTMLWNWRSALVNVICWGVEGTGPPGKNRYAYKRPSGKFQSLLC